MLPAPLLLADDRMGAADMHDDFDAEASGGVLLRESLGKPLLWNMLKLQASDLGSCVPPGHARTGSWRTMMLCSVRKDKERPRDLVTCWGAGDEEDFVVVCVCVWGGGRIILTTILNGVFVGCRG
jgi:hypothetical protein